MWESAEDQELARVGAGLCRRFALARARGCAP